ncbi:MAG TPA: anti-sigma factor antagonist [Trebonia sp.]|nr:anti-sigma factor antagonist [Trebonia sp.]
MDFELSVSPVDGCVVVIIRGECDVTNAGRLREALLALLARRSARMVLDLSRVSFLDCAAARALVAASRRARLLGGSLAVAAPTASAARLLQLTGLGARLTIYPATDVALAAVRPVRRAIPAQRSARVATARTVPAPRRHERPSPAGS